MSKSEDTHPYAVVLDDEGQYSIWPDDRELPPGWRREGTSGSESVCQAYLDQLKAETRAAALRHWMDEHKNLADD